MIKLLVYSLLIFLLLCSSVSADIHPFTGLPLDAKGFTDLDSLTASGYDSARVVFVSSASGNDTNAGANIVSNGHYGVSDLTFDTDGFFQAPGGVIAFATVAAAFIYCREGEPDIILLERGGAWNAGFTVDDRLKSGSAQATPQIISSYGPSGARPKLTDVQTDELGRSYIFMSGLHFFITDWTTETRVIDVNSGHYQTYEDNYLEGTFKEIITGDSTYIVFRRNVWVHNAAHDGQVFVGACTKSVVEENVFYEPYDQSFPSLESKGRNIYAYGTDVVIRGNIFYDSDREGLDMRRGGWAESNLIVQSYLRFGDEGTGLREEAGGTILSNMLMEDSTQMRLVGNNGTTINDNVLTIGSGGIAVLPNNDATPPLSQAKNIDIYGNTLSGLLLVFTDFIDDLENVSIYSNQIQQSTSSVLIFPTEYLAFATFADNKYFSTGAAADWFDQGTFAQWVTASGETGATDTEITYTDPDRTLSTYQTSLGATATTAAFMATAITQSRSTWDINYMAITPINYLRSGFDKSAISLSYDDPYGSTTSTTVNPTGSPVTIGVAGETVIGN